MLQNIDVARRSCRRSSRIRTDPRQTGHSSTDARSRKQRRDQRVERRRIFPAAVSGSPRRNLIPPAQSTEPRERRSLISRRSRSSDWRGLRSTDRGAWQRGRNCHGVEIAALAAGSSMRYDLNLVRAASWSLFETLLFSPARSCPCGVPRRHRGSLLALVVHRGLHRAPPNSSAPWSHSCRTAMSWRKWRSRKAA